MKPFVFFVAMLISGLIHAGEWVSPDLSISRIQGEYLCQDRSNGVSGSQIGLQMVAKRIDEFNAQWHMNGLSSKNEYDSRVTVQLSQNQLSGNQTELFFQDNTLSGHMASFDSLDCEKVIRKSPTHLMKAPEGATVMFSDLNDTIHWDPAFVDTARMALKSLADEGVIIDEHYKGKKYRGLVSDSTFGDHFIHLEFYLPLMPDASGQGRANSGVYPHGIYEIQVTDIFGNSGTSKRAGGGIYNKHEPILNPALPPLQWQTFDIQFIAPKWEGEQKTENAKMWVWWNGQLIHDGVEIESHTGGGVTNKESTEGPLMLQDHGYPVLYRNIWVIEGEDRPDFPAGPVSSQSNQGNLNGQAHAKPGHLHNWLKTLQRDFLGRTSAKGNLL